MNTRNKILHDIAEKLKSGSGIPETEYKYETGHMPYSENVVDEEGGRDYLIIQENHPPLHFKIEMWLCMSEDQKSGTLSFNMKGTGQDENYTLYLYYDESIHEAVMQTIIYQIDFWS